MTRILTAASSITLALSTLLHADPESASSKTVEIPEYKLWVTETHASSLKLREAALRKTIAKKTCFPDGIWGDNLWCLAALYLNEKTDDANARRPGADCIPGGIGSRAAVTRRFPQAPRRARESARGLGH